MALPLYGLDIETDTAAGGLDPRSAAILAVALSTDDGDTVFTGDEAGVLRSLDRHLAALDPGIVVTWNGAAFDLPFVADRAARLGIGLGLRLVWDAGDPGRHGPLPGHPGRYRACWHQHRHLDAYRAYRAFTPESDGCGLKATARREGVAAVEADASTVHLLDIGAMRSYVASDAAAARRLAQARWGQVRAHVDPLRADSPATLFHLGGADAAASTGAGRVAQATQLLGSPDCDQHLSPGDHLVGVGVGDELPGQVAQGQHQRAGAATDLGVAQRDAGQR